MSTSEFLSIVALCFDAVGWASVVVSLELGVDLVCIWSGQIPSFLASSKSSIIVLFWCCPGCLSVSA